MRVSTGNGQSGWDSLIRVATAVALACALTPIAIAEQAPPPISIWQRIRYPPVAIPGIPSEHLTFSVSSGGHRSGSEAEPSHLRLDIYWSARDGVQPPNPIASRQDVMVKFHTADSKVLTPPPQPDWLGIGMGGWTTWSLINILPWSRNALDEAWFEVRLAAQTWWIELPYGFARNPEDPEIPDRERDVPRFLPTMEPLGASDILVPWLDVEYEIGRAQNGAVLSLNLSNPFDARASVVSYREPPTQVGPDASRQNLDAPRVSVTLGAGGRNLAGHDLARRLSDDRHTRTDEFTFDRTSRIAVGRMFGTITVAIDDQRYSVRVPSSLFMYIHGRTDPENKRWMAESR